MYSPQVLEHFTHPRNCGDLPGPSAVGRSENPACGDLVVLSLAVADDRITEARFRAKGCATTIACCSRLTELLTGTPTAEAARRFDRETLAAELGGLPPTSNHSAELAVLALRQALGTLGVGSGARVGSRPQAQAHLHPVDGPRVPPAS
jgi:nitrogen fixation protein NifU and related proteins